ncbi:hypothetical protein DXG01_009430 [Tephrocybe rancida]|nr:hypothetical protein DXG01_009430 [Tephrocybe rancida]
MISFVDGDDDAAFGFLDPARIIRGVHLIPSFCHGKTSELFPPSNSVCAPSESDQDYRLYNVVMFVDWDMLMRFHGRDIALTDGSAACNLHPDVDVGKEPGKAASSSNALSDEEDDYGYTDLMAQQVESDTEPENSDSGGDDDEEADDLLGPEDGEEYTQDMEDLLGYVEF